MNARAVQTGSFYLHAWLAPLADILARDDVTDIYLNRPGEVWIETSAGEVGRQAVPGLDEATLLRLARQIAALSHQGISREHPLLSAILPDGARIQIAIPPATRRHVAFAIRKHVAVAMSLEDYAGHGAFSQMRIGALDSQDSIKREIEALLRKGDVPAALRLAVRSRRNILVSGGTSTGKTTFLNALLREVPPQERLILIEDTPELQVPHANMVGLIAARSALGEADIRADDLVAASLRMRPDRIILGELRGPEAFAFLRAVNTGHPGSMTTVHADSAERAVEQIVLLVLQAGTQLTRDDVRHYVRSTIDIYVQLVRENGQRRVAEMICK